jgi:predicted dehydrogenase
MGIMVSNWHSLNIPECRLRIDGKEGSMLSLKNAVISDSPCNLMVHPLNGDMRQQDCSRKNAFTLAMGESMKRVMEAINSGTQPPHSGRDNLETMAIVDAAYLSADRDGEKVDID